MPIMDVTTKYPNGIFDILRCRRASGRHLWRMIEPIGRIERMLLVGGPLFLLTFPDRSTLGEKDGSGPRMEEQGIAELADGGRIRLKG
jgi:hypothetical protein